MERRLAALTLDPEVTVQFLNLIEFDLALNEDVHLLREAGRADDIPVTLWQDSLAAHASGGHDSEAAEASVRVDLLLRNGFGVITREQLKLGPLLVTEDGLEYPDQRLLDLVLNVVSGVNRQVVLQSIDWVFGLLVGFGVFRAFDDYVCHTVSNVRR